MKHIKSFKDFDIINENYNNKITQAFTNEVLKHYLACALWSGGEDGEFDSLSYIDFDRNETKKAKIDIRAFLKQVYNAGLLNATSAEQFGHDFWLTRNGHGAGFWDRSYDNDENGDIGDRLSDIAKSFGEKYIYMGDDGKPYFE